jgi:hypothetical protein
MIRPMASLGINATASVDTGTVASSCRDAIPIAAAIATMQAAANKADRSAPSHPSPERRACAARVTRAASEFQYASVYGIDDVSKKLVTMAPASVRKKTIMLRSLIVAASTAPPIDRGSEQ